MLRNGTAHPVVLEVHNDITDRKHAEEALREARDGLEVRVQERTAALQESEQRLKLAQQAARVGAFDWDIRTGVNVWTPELEALYGLPPGGFAQTEAAWEQLVHPQDRAQAIRLVDRALETGEHTEAQWRVVWPDGSVHWLAGRWQVFKDESGKAYRMTGVNLDITERKAAEAAVRESEERLRFALETSHAGAWDLDLGDHTAYRSLEHDRVFGYEQPLPHWTYEMFLEHVLPEDRAMVDAKFRQATAIGSDWSFECRIRRIDGEIRWIWAAGRHRTDTAGQTRRMAGIVQDITERKRAEAELAKHREHLEELVQERARQLETANQELREREQTLRDSEERYHRFFEDDVAGDFISTPEGRILLCNSAFAEVFGFSSAQEAVGTSILDLYPDPGERGPLLERLRQERKIDRLAVWRKRRDGEPVHIVENLVGHFNDQGELYEIKGYVSEDTERQRAERALGERMKELACLYAVSRDMQEELSLDELCRACRAPASRHAVPGAYRGGDKSHGRSPSGYSHQTSSPPLLSNSISLYGTSTYCIRLPRIAGLVSTQGGNSSGS